jgi:Raf kinase inhibitor-like YbhB/YbcL family protein
MLRKSPIVAIAAGAAVACGAGDGASSAMRLTSSAFAENESIPERFTCEGEDVSPPLAWSGVPAEARSLALIVDDPDAPGGTFRHWGLFDLATDRPGLDEGAGSTGRGDFREARNDFNRIGYSGPCPPRGRGPHRYRFRLLALDVGRLGAGADPRTAEVERRAQPHVIASAVLTARFERR